MEIVGCDLHTCYQQIAMLDAETDEVVAPLEHETAQSVGICAIYAKRGDPRFPEN